MNIEKDELLQGTLYEMYLKSRAYKQVMSYCAQNGGDVDVVSAQVMSNIIEQSPKKLAIYDYDDIGSLFIWSDTPEHEEIGGRYWEEISDH